MCGIAGFVGGDRKKLNGMLDKISHRGPDDRRTFIEGEVGLGSLRLAIIDLSSKGHQPMFDQEKSLVIVYNGEIYNFLDLKKILEKKYKFKSNTDTEVLLYGYKEWGVECLKKVNGMFSFVIYDKKRNLLFGARDRLGEKPLKYYWDGYLFAFASEIKGLLPILNNKPEIDPIAINHFLTLQYVPSPLTGFKKIFKLAPGHYFIFKEKKLTIKKYWGLDFYRKLSLSETEWGEILLQKLEESVQSRLITDVPLGAFLSGGVDSSAIVALMSKYQKPKTFNIAFENPKFDESKYADLIAKQYKTDHKTLKVTNKMMSEMFLKLANFYDEPFADNSAIPTLILSRFASKYVKVALTGDGGDENFAGYDRYNIVALSNQYGKIPKLIRTLLTGSTFLASAVTDTQFTSRANRYTKTFDLPFYKKYLYYSCFFDNQTKYNLYSEDFRSYIDDTFEIFKSLYSTKLSNLDNALNFDIQNYLPEDLLFKTDIASMAFSLETRAPFLNHELVELAAKIPANLKIRLFNKKYILKKILEKNRLVPTEILNRPKKGFVAPIERWLKQDFKKFTLEMLTSKKFRDTNIFDEDNLLNYLKNYYDNQQISSNNIFALLSLASWINKYF